MAPVGSSMESASSSTSTRSGVNPPATPPTKSDPIGEAKAAHALEATRPASQPFAQRLASGLPKRKRVTEYVAASAPEAESSVLIAVAGSAASGACTQRIAPAAFQASQPTSASKQPKST